jgi:hypothetical protein
MLNFITSTRGGPGMPSGEKPKVQAVEGGPKEIQVGKTEIVTITDLLADPIGVIQKVNESKTPAAITRYGEFLALILPLSGTGVQHLTFTQETIVSDFETMINESDQTALSYTSEELESKLGVSANEKPEVSKEEEEGIS